MCPTIFHQKNPKRKTRAERRSGRVSRVLFLNAPNPKNKQAARIKREFHKFWYESIPA